MSIDNNSGNRPINVRALMASMPALDPERPRYDPLTDDGFARFGNLFDDEQDDSSAALERILGLGASSQAPETHPVPDVIVTDDDVKQAMSDSFEAGAELARSFKAELAKREAANVQTFTDDSFATRQNGMGLTADDVLSVVPNIARWGGKGDGKGVTAKEALERFNLTFEYKGSPILFLDQDGELREGKGKQTYIWKPGHPLHGNAIGSVGKDYGIIQPSELAIIDDVSGGIPVERGGWFRNGAEVWLQSSLGIINTPAGPAEKRILVTNSADGSSGFKIWMTMVVVACRNTYAHAFAYGSGFSIRHTKDAAERVRELRNALQAAYASGDEVFAKAQARMFELAEKRLTKAQLDEVVDSLFKVTRDADGVRELSTRKENQIASFVDGYWNAPGSHDSAFGIMQAATWYANSPDNENGMSLASSTDRFGSMLTGTVGRFEKRAYQTVQRVLMNV